jgi:hypothetical protein
MAKEDKENNLSILESYANKIGGVYQFRELPPLIDVPYPCFAIADLPEIISKLSPATPEERKIALQEEFLQIQKTYLDSGFTLLSIDSRILGMQVTQEAEDIAQSDLSIGIVNMDRSICTDCHGSQFFHLNVSRGEKEGLAFRPGIIETPQQQVDSLIEWVKTNNFREVVLVDDVLAYGDTMVPLIKQLQDQLSNVSINVLVGIASSQGKWSGIEKVLEKTGVVVQCLSLVKASPENEWSTGMSIPVSRDLTIFGGKVGIDDETNLHTIFPYLLPAFL